MDSTTAPRLSASSLSSDPRTEAAVVELVTRLLRPEERAAAALALAARLGGKALLLFVRDPEIGALLPAPGFPQTLAGGRAWHSFLDLCLETGSQTGALRLKADADPLPAIGFPVAGDAVLVLLGATAVSEEVPGALLLLPILVAALRAEHLAATAATEARGALEAAERAAAVTGTLTAARSALQEALPRRTGACGARCGEQPASGASRRIGNGQRPPAGTSRGARDPD